MIHSEPWRQMRTAPPLLRLSAAPETKSTKVMETRICRIWPLSTPDIVHYLKMSWDEDLGNGFTIILCNGEHAWSGKVSNDQITIEANEAEMDREKYVEDLRRALTMQEEKTKNYSFDFIKDSERDVFHFSYDKVSQDISFKLGSVELQAVPDSTEVINELINFVFHRNAELRGKNDHLQQENTRLLSERNYSLEELEKYVKAKEDLEQDLYSRFILVLNEKKAKIRQLLDRVKCAHEQSQDRSAVATSQETPLSTKEDSACNTDEDLKGHTSETRSLALPSKSAIDPCEGDPIDSGLHDMVDIAPSRKRRYRNPKQKVEVAEPPKALEDKRTCPVSSALSTGIHQAEEEQEESLSTLPNTVEPDNLFDKM